MRYAIISDIHGNLQALQEVLSLIGRQEVDRIVCLGDIVGYGADPSACIDLVRKECCSVIMGNHDAAAVGLTSIEYFNPVAREAALWTGKVLTDEQREYLSQLPYKGVFEDFDIVHSTPDQPELWRYLMQADNAGPLFSYFTSQILFYGHTHVPMVFRYEESCASYCEPADFCLENEKRYIVNVGSVGQPRDFDPRASFVVFDSRGKRVSYHRQTYDLAEAQERIIRNGLPPVLAARLSYGR